MTFIQAVESSCTMAHRAPRPLCPGDRIVAFAPGGKVDREKVLAGAQVLRALGYEVVLPDALYCEADYYAGTLQERQEVLAAICLRADARVVWAARGGSGTAQAAQGLHIQGSTVSLPWLVGYSDITTLHNLWGQARTQSVHGADLQTLASWSPRQTRELLSLLSSPDTVSQIFEGEGHAAKERTAAVGRLWGGNLTVLASLAGTPLLSPPEEDSLLFIEDVGEPPYRLDRSLTQLAQSGALAHVRGVAVGSLSFEDEATLNYTGRGLLLRTLRRLGLPVLTGISVGHIPDSRPLLLGVQATLDATRGTLVVGA